MWASSRKTLKEKNLKATQKIFDKEYLGARQGRAEGEDWRDVIVDKPLSVNPKFKFSLRLMGPCPAGFTRHFCFLDGNEIICANPATRILETIDAENEVWVDKERSAKFPRRAKSKNVQYGLIGKDHFFAWDRNESLSPAHIHIYDKTTMESQVEIREFPLPEDYFYGKLFSIGNQLFLQSRIRPPRDNIGAVWQHPHVDDHSVHKNMDSLDKGTTRLYRPESVFSRLFYFNFDENSWFMLPDVQFFSCAMVVKSPDEKKVYFLSKLNQGYVLDTTTWKVTPLHLIGRPRNISDGCSAVHFEGNIVAIGGGWPVFDHMSFLQRQQGPLAMLGKFNPNKKIPPSLLLNKFSPRIVVLDLKTKEWSVPLVESDSMSQWESLAYSSCVPYKNKIFIIGGENKRGETRKVWVLESNIEDSAKSRNAE